FLVFFFSSRRRHTRFSRDWSSDVCSSDLAEREVPWTLFPGMEISIDEQSTCLTLRSPYLPPMAEGEWYPTSDRISLEPDGRFHRSEERRVGKEWTCRWAPNAYMKRIACSI